MFWTDDPVADAERYYAAKEDELEKLPKCDYCGHPITDDHCYDFGDEVICESCLNDHFKKHIDDYIE